MINGIKTGDYLSEIDKETIAELVSIHKIEDINFMLDIETLGKEQDGFCPIVSISLVPFTDTHIFENISIYSKIDLYQYDNPKIMNGIVPTPSISTIKWWLGQSKESQKELFGGDSSLLQTLVIMKEFIDTFKNYSPEGSNQYIYAKSPDFDLVLCSRWLKGLMRLESFNFVKYNHSRCVRTVKSEALKRVNDKERFLSSFPDGKETVLHNAFNDCVLQIKQVQYCWNYRDEVTNMI